MATDEKQKALDWINSVSCPILCGHLEINGFEVIRGVVCHTGLNLELFDKFDKVLSGHFHIRATNGKVHYLGNPYETNWGEYGYSKGFHIFDTQHLELSFINNPVSNYHSEVYNDTINIDKLDKNLYTDKIVRIVIGNNGYNKNKFNLFLDMINDLAHSVEVIETVEAAKTISSDAEIKTMTSIDLINQYIDTQQTDLNKDELRGYILSLYQEALEKPTLATLSQ